MYMICIFVRLCERVNKTLPLVSTNELRRYRKSCVFLVEMMMMMK